MNHFLKGKNELKENVYTLKVYMAKEYNDKIR